jgi:hypothetical protein
MLWMWSSLLTYLLTYLLTSSSSGLGAYAPDAPQPIGLLCDTYFTLLTCLLTYLLTYFFVIRVRSICPRCTAAYRLIVRYLLYCTHLFTYLLTPWSRVLLEKPAGLQVVKKFPAFNADRRFIGAFTCPPPPVPILSQLDLVHTLTSHFLKIVQVRGFICEYFVTRYVLMGRRC